MQNAYIIDINNHGLRICLSTWVNNSETWYGHDDWFPLKPLINVEILDMINTIFSRFNMRYQLS